MSMNLREEIAKLTTPAPVFCDPEDDLEDVTAAKLTEKSGEKDEFAPLPATKLRQRAAAAESVNNEKKYAGRKISRQKLLDLDSDVSGSEEQSESESEQEDESSLGEEDVMDDKEDGEKDEESDDESESMGSEEPRTAEEAEEELSTLGSFKAKMASSTDPQEAGQKFSFVDDGDYSKYYDSEEEAEDQSDDDDEDTDDNEEEGDDDEESMEEDENEVEEGEGGVSSFSKSRLNEEIQKGEAARQQLGLWDSLLEGRIKFQKILTAVNQLPQPDTWRDFEKLGEDNFKEKSTTVQTGLENLLQKLIQLQSVLLLQNSETQHIESGQQKPVKKTEDPDDEEITSESDTEETKQTDEKSTVQHKGRKRKLAMEEIPDFLAKRHKDFQNYRNDTLQKWFDKTRLLGGKISSKSFNAFEQSALKQIEQVLSDRDRLIKRTQMKRASYKVLGKPEEAETAVSQDQEPLQETSIKTSEQTYDAEIFDDSDFYHQQLRELIERKTSDINDPIALSRQWLEIQRLRNKVKRKVETRASKGRKIR
ncbi:protein AATF-like [Saccostrea cucullata]|uniref:protein AATF-like n=1 Tax=Saccostrea cuccullata TaxID=36930 RepID=UPI002ED2ECFB